MREYRGCRQVLRVFAIIAVVAVVVLFSPTGTLLASAQTVDTAPLPYQQQELPTMMAPTAATGSVSVNFQSNDEISDCGWSHPFDLESALTNRIDEVVGCSMQAQPFGTHAWTTSLHTTAAFM